MPAREHTILHIHDHKISFTINLGLSNKKEYHHIDEILQHTEELLYNVKSAGRNRLIKIFTSIILPTYQNCFI
jgi:PleD family two-component response regulator